MVIQEDDPHNPLNHVLLNMFFKEIIAYPKGVDIMRLRGVTLIGDQSVWRDLSSAYEFIQENCGYILSRSLQWAPYTNDTDS